MTSDGKKGQEKMQEASPYYLHASEGPGNQITTVQLKGDNYEDWSKHVRNALRTKRKLGFIDVHELKADIACCKQQGDSVMVFYGRLKKMWDELAVYKPIRSCSCGELAALLQQDQDEDRTHEFLMGLDDSRFGTVRSTITSIEPLPKLSQVYQRIVREERQQTIVRNRDEKTDAVGFTAQAGPRVRTWGNNRDGDLVCTHCGKSGHEVAECYQLKGYPEWWGERGRNSSSRGSFRGRGRGGGMVGYYGRGRGVASHPQGRAN